MPKERLHPEEFRLVANAIANGDRYKILHQIYSRLAVSIGQIAGELEMSSARVSRHVRRLERARLVQRVREGGTWYWMACQERWRAFLDDSNSLGIE
jgi:DNA-binding transcriptional ArsR family regulator